MVLYNLYLKKYIERKIRNVIVFVLLMADDATVSGMKGNYSSIVKK